MDVRYNTLDLFAGAGGASLGLREAGFHHALCVEWDEDAAETLWAADFPAANADVRKKKVYKSIDRIHLLWASPPCQAFSTAGQRKGAEDERNGWPWTIDIIDYLKKRGVGPRYVVCENVQGLTYHQGGCTGGRKDCAGCYWEGWIIPEFKKRFAWVGHATLNAADFGVPQHRKRVFLVAGDGPIRWPEPTHGPPNAAKQGALFGNGVRPWVTVRDALNIDAWATETNTSSGMARVPRSSDTPSCSPVAGGKALGGLLEVDVRVLGIETNPYRKDADGEWIKEDRKYKDITDTPAGCVSSRGPLDNQGPFIVERSSGAREPTKRSVDKPAPTVIVGPSGGYDRLSITEQEQKPDWFHRISPVDEPTRTIGSMANASISIPGAGSEPWRLDEPSATVTTTEEKGTRGKHMSGGPDRAADTMWRGAGVRRLTWKECAALQSFPDGYPFQGKTKKSLYRQVGNAVPPPLARALGQAVKEALDAG